MRRKWLNILLLLCLTIPVALSFSWLYYQKLMIRDEVKDQIVSGISKKNLVLLKFSEKDKKKLDWERNSKEFKYQDEFYDIVDKKVENDTTFYWCWQDNKETAITKKINSLLADALGNRPRNKENQERLTQFLQSLYLSDFQSVNNLMFQSKEQLISYYSFLDNSLSIPPPTPPPKLV